MDLETAGRPGVRVERHEPFALRRRQLGSHLIHGVDDPPVELVDHQGDARALDGRALRARRRRHRQRERERLVIEHHRDVGAPHRAVRAQQQPPVHLCEARPRLLAVEQLGAACERLGVVASAVEALVGRPIGVGELDQRRVRTERQRDQRRLAGGDRIERQAAVLARVRRRLRAALVQPLAGRGAGDGEVAEVADRSMAREHRGVGDRLRRLAEAQARARVLDAEPDRRMVDRAVAVEPEARGDRVPERPEARRGRLAAAGARASGGTPVPQVPQHPAAECLGCEAASAESGCAPLARARAAAARGGVLLARQRKSPAVVCSEPGPQDLQSFQKLRAPFEYCR